MAASHCWVYLDNCDQFALVRLVTGENATDDPTPDITISQMGDNWQCGHQSRSQSQASVLTARSRNLKTWSKILIRRHQHESSHKWWTRPTTSVGAWGEQLTIYRRIIGDLVIDDTRRHLHHRPGSLGRRDAGDQEAPHHPARPGRGQPRDPGLVHVLDTAGDCPQWNDNIVICESFYKSYRSILIIACDLWPDMLSQWWIRVLHS